MSFTGSGPNKNVFNQPPSSAVNVNVPQNANIPMGMQTGHPQHVSMGMGMPQGGVVGNYNPPIPPFVQTSATQPPPQNISVPGNCRALSHERIGLFSFFLSENYTCVLYLTAMAQKHPQMAPNMHQGVYSGQQMQQPPPNKIVSEKRERPGRQQMYHQVDKTPPAPFSQANVASSHHQQQQPPPAVHQPVQQQNSVEGQRCEMMPPKPEHRKVISHLT